MGGYNVLRQVLTRSKLGLTSGHRQFYFLIVLFYILMINQNELMGLGYNNDCDFKCDGSSSLWRASSAWYRCVFVCLLLVCKRFCNWNRFRCTYVWCGQTCYSIL